MKNNVLNYAKSQEEENRKNKWNQKRWKSNLCKPYWVI